MQDQLIASSHVFVNDSILANPNPVEAGLAGQLRGTVWVRIGSQ